MVTTPLPQQQKVSKVEGIKERSNYLREPVASQLLEDTTHFSEEAIQILKFHGSYQQDNRDNRVQGQEKDYQFMLRTRNPGGYIPAELYLTLDRLSDELGNHTLRVTTRQGFQIHGILKKNLKTAIASIVQNLGSTLGACGDLNRNVMAPPAPFKNRPEYLYAQDYANRVADLLTPQTGAYYEIWLDGEKAISGEEHPEVKAARQSDRHGTLMAHSEEPLYGEQYMPRKFKISVTVPGDNSIDVYTHDLSLIVITDDRGQLQGFNILVGGGLGRTHRKEETFPRIADPLGYVDKADIYDLVKAVVATQRDYGDRTQRRHARMKYLINDWGIEKFRSKVESYLGKAIAPFQPLPEWKFQDYLGWYDQGDGKRFLGLSIENGRVKDDGSFQLKSALKTIVEQFKLPICLTANQNLILYEIDPADQKTINQIFHQHGIVTDPGEINPLTRLSMACPALPTCGLAIAESERALPGIIDRIQALLNRLGMGQEEFVIRMTGCPNGCARPYVAELGFVGVAPDAYQLWLGGTPNQTVLARVFTEKLEASHLETFLEPIFVAFKAQKEPGESLGEFVNRVGFEHLHDFRATYVSAIPTATASRVRKNRNRVSVPDEIFSQLKQSAQVAGKPMNQIVKEALEAYLSQS